MKGGTIVEDGFVYKEETHLTVLKTSLFFAGDGFTVYDSKGELVFRVDSYGPEKDNGEQVLMDASGRCILTVRRKVCVNMFVCVFICTYIKYTILGATFSVSVNYFCCILAPPS